MKKIFSALMLMACLCLAMPAQAQLKFGVKAGLNVSKVSISKEVFNPDNRTGFFISPTADVTLPLLGLLVWTLRSCTTSSALIRKKALQ